jgi:hypothetical protein
MLQNNTIAEFMLDSTGTNLIDANNSLNTSDLTFIVDDLLGEVILLNLGKLIIPTISNKNEDGAISFLFKLPPEARYVNGISIVEVNGLWTIINEKGNIKAIKTDGTDVSLNATIEQVANDEWHQLTFNSNGIIFIDGLKIGELNEPIDMSTINVILGGETTPLMQASDVKVFSVTLDDEDSKKMYQESLSVQVADINGKQKPLNSELRLQKLQKIGNLDNKTIEEKFKLLNNEVMGMFKEQFQFMDGTKQYSTEEVSKANIVVAGKTIEVSIKKQIPEVGLVDKDTIDNYLNLKLQLKEDLVKKIEEKRKTMACSFESLLQSLMNINNKQSNDDSSNDDSSNDDSSNDDSSNDDSSNND